MGGGSMGGASVGHSSRDSCGNSSGCRNRGVGSGEDGRPFCDGPPPLSGGGPSPLSGGVIGASGCGDGLGRGGEARWGWKGGEIRVEPSVSPGREKAPMPPVVHGTNDGKTLVVHGTDGGKNGVSIPWGDRQTKSRRCRLRNLTRLSHVHLSLRRDEHTGAPPFSPAQISQLRDWSPALAPLTDFEMVKI